MKPIYLPIIAMFVAQPLLAANLDKDGVPIVNIHGKIEVTSDPKAIASAKEWGFPTQRTRMIEVNGKAIPLREFLLTYCQGKPYNSTCSRGVTISRIDSLSGPRDELPKGL